MKITEIRQTAKGLGLSGYSKLNKGDLIRLIQDAEMASSPCFGADWRLQCQQLDCAWRDDCLGKQAKQ